MLRLYRLRPQSHHLDLVRLNSKLVVSVLKQLTPTKLASLPSFALVSSLDLYKWSQFQYRAFSLSLSLLSWPNGALQLLARVATSLVRAGFLYLPVGYLSLNLRSASSPISILALYLLIRRSSGRPQQQTPLFRAYLRALFALVSPCQQEGSDKHNNNNKCLGGYVNNAAASELLALPPLPLVICRCDRRAKKHVLLACCSSGHLLTMAPVNKLTLYQQSVS